MGRSFTIAYKNLPTEETIEVVHLAPTRLDKPEDFDDYFEQFLRFWRAETKQQRVYVLVSWNDFSVNLRESEAYTRGVKRIYETAAIAIVRYGGSASEQRIAGRLASVRLHKPSHIYETREEALTVIRGLREGTIKVDAS
jgi:hypothetical protein